LWLKELLPKRRLDRAWFTSYLGSYWFGQTYYFTDVLQPVSNPRQTHCLSVEFNRLDDDEIKAIFQRLELSIDSNFTYEAMIQQFGDPDEITEYVKDRKSYSYSIGPLKQYHACFTIINNENIAFFNMSTAEYA
jgi:hypothetical protein